jgi:pyridoxamine 5'-phosphate oxidase
LVTREDGEAADLYYQSRSLTSRLGAWASEQSRPLASRGKLMADVAALGVKFGTNPPRPPFWGGYRVTPLEVEFWADGAYRLHDRFRWSRQAIENEWNIKRLNP